MKLKIEGDAKEVADFFMAITSEEIKPQDLDEIAKKIAERVQDDVSKGLEQLSVKVNAESWEKIREQFLAQINAE